MVTEELDEHIAFLAKQAKCLPSEILREGLFLVFTGKTFTEHVANDRRAVMFDQGQVQRDKGVT